MGFMKFLNRLTGMFRTREEAPAAEPQDGPLLACVRVVVELA